MSVTFRACVVLASSASKGRFDGKMLSASIACCSVDADASAGGVCGTVSPMFGVSSPPVRSIVSMPSGCCSAAACCVGCCSAIAFRETVEFGFEFCLDAGWLPDCCAVSW